jgi:hypothetical protein
MGLAFEKWFLAGVLKKTIPILSFEHEKASRPESSGFGRL